MSVCLIAQTQNDAALFFKARQRKCLLCDWNTEENHSWKHEDGELIKPKVQQSN